jgi:hypothetical protein
MKRNKTFAWLLSLLLLGVQPGSLFACAACYGNPDSAMSRGLTWAITFMVGVVFCVLTGITVFFVRMNKHSAADADTGTPAESVGKPS